MDVLVAVDDSEEARQAIKHALETFPDATIRVVTVLEVELLDLSNSSDTSGEDVAREDAKNVLANAVAIAEEYGRDVETEIITGHPAKATVSFADEHDVDHIVVGSRGKSGVKRVLLGSVAETIVRRADCPVTVVR
ncbi:universal stress protein UspA [Natronococcus pandeyae]|uniref:Universal stress protein UspA n=1 Tax=Natronococcus pandeyae TaxID=2055836 RepID=A0A8J8TRE1_9EURY|nr:universal stress protein [Natronococcus pandeyae]TYL37614.1 universal stress protein UspA [Natronococcus pandeyae]